MILFKKVLKKISTIIGLIISQKRIHRIPFSIRRLGTEYGGWFVVTDNLNDKKIISCGAGEDISFDIEIAALYKCFVLIVDPTPRAKEHFQKVFKRVGEKPQLKFNPYGNPDPLSYDLKDISKKQLIFVDKALWKETKKLKFFSPKNEKNVSHSIINFQNNYSKDTKYIYVNSITLDELILKFFDKNQIPEILKLDIEGAEHEVILNMIENKIYPNQILVEFDELQKGTFRSFQRFQFTNRLLEKNGYKLFAREEFNFSYIRIMS